MEMVMASSLRSNSQLIIFSPSPQARRTMPRVLAPRSMASSFKQKLIRNQEIKRKRKKINGSPTIAEVERAIGIKTDQLSSSSSASISPLFQLLATESPAEKKLRETAEWIVENTEERAFVGQKILLLFFLKILPVWILILVVASGLVKLPFTLPLLDDLLS